MEGWTYFRLNSTPVRVVVSVSLAPDRLSPMARVRPKSLTENRGCRPRKYTRLLPLLSSCTCSHSPSSSPPLSLSLSCCRMTVESRFATFQIDLFISFVARIVIGYHPFPPSFFKEFVRDSFSVNRQISIEGITPTVT